MSEMNEDPNNLNSTVPDTANTSESSQISTLDTDAAIAKSSPDIPPGDPTIEEPESTETTDNSSSIFKQQEDSENSKCSDKHDELAAKIKSPLLIKVINLLKSDIDISILLKSLSDLLGTDENEVIAEEKKYIERLKEISDLIKQNQNQKEESELIKQNQKLETENNGLKIQLEHYEPRRRNNTYDRSRFLPRDMGSNEELEDKFNQVNARLNECQQSYQDLKDKFSNSETSRNSLLAEISSLKQNTGTHYDGTSSRPQHHELTDEYKNLKEQHLDPLAKNLSKFIELRGSELSRKEIINNIKGIISSSILISGQVIMRRDRTSSMELVTEQSKLDVNENSSSQVEESQTKSLNIESEFQYSTAGEWQKRDFEQASSELRDCFCSILKLDFKVLDSAIQTEIEAAIVKILQFLNRVALAEPPPNFQMDEKGAYFDPVCHEAAKNYEDAGKIISTIYPAYLVNNEPKVRAIVLTEA